jgi:large subunit ribosomal protein L10
LNRQEKENFVAEMKGRLERAEATFLVDYKGLDVETFNALRGELRKSQTEIRVVKNRLLKLASKDTDTAMLEEHFEGPCAVVINYEDAIAPAKTLVEQSKEHKELEIRMGQMSGQILDEAGIKRLAQLPSREVLLGQALSVMQAVPASFVRVINGVMVNLLNVLKAIEGQKGEKA